MKALSGILGRRDFLRADEVARFIVNSKNFDAATEDPAQAKTLLFFETSTQHTWLVATRQRVYCILDDRRKPKPHINWAMSRSKVLADDGSVSLDIGVDERDTPSPRSGLLHFGPKHRRWLYSKSLFSSEPPAQVIEGFFKDALAR